MKLNRLDSTTRRPSADAIEHVHSSTDERVRRVGATEAIEGDRQRSLQQELAEFDVKAIGPFEGGERIQQDAHAVAQRLVSLGHGADALIKPGLVKGVLHKIDDKV